VHPRPFRFLLFCHCPRRKQYFKSTDFTRPNSPSALVVPWLFAAQLRSITFAVNQIHTSHTPQQSKMKTTFSALAAFASITSAHFNLDYPAARGFDEDKLVQFPCGSFNTPVSNRTVWPISGGSIALTMGYAALNFHFHEGKQRLTVPKSHRCEC